MALGVGLALACAVPASVPAHVPDANPIAAQLYWANTGTDSIGRASELDPTNFDTKLIEGASDPLGVTFDGTYLYWTNTATNRIGRGNLDATGIDQSYVTTAGTPAGIAADDGHLYWTQTASGSGTIGRVGLDGFGSNQGLVSIGAAPCGVAAGPSALFWANAATMALPLGSIGRSSISGAGTQQNFLTATSDPCGVAIAGDRLYWTNRGGNSIGRANLDGTGADAAFLPMLTGKPCGIAVDGGHIYWTSDAGTIGRARLDGTIDTQTFISGLSDPCGMTLAPTMEASPASQGFPGTEVGRASADRTIEVANTSSAALGIAILNMVGANPGSFAISSDSCTGVVPAGGSCQIKVRFAPSRAGARNAQLRISGNGSNLPYLVGLSGSALPDKTRPRVLSAAARPRVFAGRTTLRFRLTEAAQVSIAVKRLSNGKRAGRLTYAGAEGANQRRFAGRIGGRELSPGAYAAEVVATDKAGNHSRVSRFGFRVVG